MLLPAAVLALFLVPLGSEVVQTAPIQCGFGPMTHVRLLRWHRRQRDVRLRAL